MLLLGAGAGLTYLKRSSMVLSCVGDSTQNGSGVPREKKWLLVPGPDSEVQQNPDSRVEKYKEDSKKFQILLNGKIFALNEYGQ